VLRALVPGSSSAAVAGAAAQWGNFQNDDFINQ
jgi:hypothetical protein